MSHLDEFQKIARAVDNSELVRYFVPQVFDGDTFVYTEILNRNKRSGNNKGRLERTFYHRFMAEFDAQLPDIMKWCDFTGARAYTRLSPRSFKKVGHRFFQHQTEQVLAENWEGMRHGYAHACGISTPLVKYWLFDVDDPTMLAEAEAAIDAVPFLPKAPSVQARLVTIPSRKGYHIVTRPFDPRTLRLPPGVELKKDANTNLYIPVNG